MRAHRPNRSIHKHFLIFFSKTYDNIVIKTNYLQIFSSSYTWFFFFKVFSFFVSWVWSCSNEPLIQMVSDFSFLKDFFYFYILNSISNYYLYVALIDSPCLLLKKKEKNNQPTNLDILSYLSYKKSFVKYLKYLP